jgi:radical SAM protein with 4Fe4S-binding SPASM domain
MTQFIETTQSRQSRQSRPEGSSNVPVNKGHFDLDTPERVATFHEILGRGWEKYQEYRQAWHQYPTKQFVGDYPIIVDIELASSCNLNCPMCYTTTEHYKNNVKRQLMDWNLYKRVVDEVSDKVYALRLSWRGESTLHKKFVDAVRYAKEKGVREVSFLTNGWRLDLDYFVELHNAGADWITVSFDGVDDEYNKIRAPLNYDTMMDRLETIHKYKKKNNIEKPVIKIQGIWPAIRNNPDYYYKKMSAVSNLVAFNPLIDYLGKDKEIVYEENFSCPQLYQRLFVSSTGDVMMCNSDEYGEEIIGNVHEESIHQIWHGERLEKIRKLHAVTDGFKKLSVCRRCFYPRKTEVNEVAKVGNRTILIENYINRAQEVGE